jgi:hypothetical protein
MSSVGQNPALFIFYAGDGTQGLAYDKRTHNHGATPQPLASF